MRRIWVVVTLILLGSLAGLRLLLAPELEPVYAGKTVSQWLDAGFEDSAMALQEIGPAAGPYVLSKLAREDPRYGSSRLYRIARAKLPPLAQMAVPRPEPANFDELRAHSSLLELGPGIIPLLSSRLQDRNPAVRSVCARTLGSLRLRGSDVRLATTGLNEAARDRNPDVKASADWALSERTMPIARRKYFDHAAP